MFFSSEVKEELLKHNSSARHCQMAELSALIGFGAKLTTDDDEETPVLLIENDQVRGRILTMIRKVFHKDPEEFTGEDFSGLLEMLHLVFSGSGEVREIFLKDTGLISRSCCRRAFVRGAFLGCGSISDPNASYHLELVTASLVKAEILKDLMENLEIPAKITRRKNHFVVYVKESDGIVDFLGVAGAHVALMKLENIIIETDMKNQINRTVNCETANLGKTVSASVRQKEDIEYLMDTGRWMNLSPALREIAELRLEYPIASFKELGEMLDPPVGKSGVNHRLRKISEIADKYRGEEE